MTASPMFPLGAVLFPHVPIPLRIFEPRYLMMIGQLLDQDDPEFGVVLIERGSEAGGGDQRASVGTMARLVKAVVGADDLFVIGMGTQRFTVDRWADDDPYPRAEVSMLPDLAWSPALEPLLVEAETAVRRLAARVTETLSEADDIELSDDPVAAAWQLAAIAPLGEYDQYTLLRSTTMGDLLRQLLDLALEADELWSAE
jgi:hypothetical protein